MSVTRTTLGAVVDFTNGGAWNQSEYVDTGIPVVRVSDIHDETIRLDECKYLARESLDKYHKHLLQTSDVVVATVGSHPTQPGSVVGRAARVPSSANGTLLNQNAVRLRPLNGGIDAKYLRYLAVSQYFRNFIIAHARGSANQVRMAISLLKDMPICLPSVERQRTIGEILSAYDDLIENNTRRIRILEQMAQMLYREWFVNFRFPGHEKAKIVESELGPIPNTWNVFRFSELVESALGGDWGSEEITSEEQATVRVIRGTDFDDLRTGNALRVPQRFITEASLNKRKLRTNDIVVENSVNAKTRAAGSSIRITEGMLQRLRADSIAASFCRVFRPKNPRLSVILTLHMQRLHREGGMNFYQNVAANGIANFQTTRFLDAERIALPSDTNDIMRLVEILEPFVSSNSAERIQILRATRDLLLPKLVCGEISVEQCERKAFAQMA